MDRRRGHLARYRAFVLVPAVLLIAAGAVAADKKTANEAEEAAIRANVNAFVKAYNAGDAKAIANLFVADAQILDEDEKTTQGRDAIERDFAAIFAKSPQTRIAVDVSSIRFIGSALAIETGSTKTASKPGEVPEVTRYTVVHTKSSDGNWLMAFARDTPIAGNASLDPATEVVPGTGSARETARAREPGSPSQTGSPPQTGDAPTNNFERLKPLAWMIGSWIDEGNESIVLSSCKWSADKNYILQKIEVRTQGRDALDLSQRIGWDPLSGRIKSWMFDSDGGYGESYWTQKGNHWLLKATGVRRDGTTSSATNILIPTSKDSYTWRSVFRVIGTEKMPPIEVKVVRKPPEPAK